MLDWNPQDGKSACEQEVASFCSCFYTNPAGQEADMIKIKTFSKSSCEIDAILASATKWWMSLSVTQVVNALLCSELYFPLDQSSVAVAGATNVINTRQSEAVTVSLFFLHLHPHTINPTTPTHSGFKTSRRPLEFRWLLDCMLPVTLVIAVCSWQTISALLLIFKTA